MANQKYLTKVPLSYKGKHVDAGEVVDDIPSQSVKWLLKDDLIEKVAGSQSRSTGKKAAATRAAKAEGEEIKQLHKEAKKEAKGTEIAPEAIAEEKWEVSDGE